MGYPEQYRDIELNPPPREWLDAEPKLDGSCRGGDHPGCVGPPGTVCECPCHVLGYAIFGTEPRW